MTASAATFEVTSSGLMEPGVTENTIVMTRGGDNGALYISSNNSTQKCNFDGRTIVLSVPLGLKPADMFYELNLVYQRSYELMVDQINLHNCGVRINGKHHPLLLQIMSADSTPQKTAAASEYLAPLSDFMFSPYSSGLAYHVSVAADNSNNTVMIANGAVRPDVFSGKPASFGILPTGYSYLQQLLPLLASKGAESIYYVMDGTPGNFVKGLCAYVPDFVWEYNITLMGAASIQDTGDVEIDFDATARNLSSLNPDILVNCIDSFCDKWMASLRRVNWSPKALVITVCPGSSSFEEQVGTDREFVLGVNPWVPTLKAADDVVNWTASEFAFVFEDFSSGIGATYHAAAATAQVSLAVQALQQSQSLLTEDLAKVLSEASVSNPFYTLYGDIFFTDIGQADLKVLGTQYDLEGNLQVVAPLEKADLTLVYPMPTWANRDCVKLSPCGQSEGNSNLTRISIPSSNSDDGTSCNPDGTCLCQSPDRHAVGIGSTAACHLIYKENMTYIDESLKAIGIAFLVVQLLASAIAISWTIVYRKKNVVRMSQPIFLVVVAVGCTVLSLSIIPLSVEADYRYQQDPYTGELLLSKPNNEIVGADIACMAAPWLFGIGFIVAFSALFAKIHRLCKIMIASQSCRRINVAPKDVMIIMLVLLVLETTILLVWQLVAPLQWERTVLSTDVNAYPTKSVGKCQTSPTEDLIYFIIPFCVLNMGCLLYALYLSFVTRNLVHSMNLSEGMWITASMTGIFQILLLGIPVLFIVSNDANAFYFVKVCLVFIVSMSVTLFIFLPKMYGLYFDIPHGRSTARFSTVVDMEAGGSRRSSVFSLSTRNARSNTAAAIVEDAVRSGRIIIDKSKRRNE